MLRVDQAAGDLQAPDLAVFLLRRWGVHDFLPERVLERDHELPERLDRVPLLRGHFGLEDRDTLGGELSQWYSFQNMKTVPTSANSRRCKVIAVGIGTD